MNWFSRRLALGMLASLIVIVPAGLAWACVGVVSLTTSSNTVQPGGTLSVVGREFASGAPVMIHLDTLDGRVLATVAMPGEDTMTSKFTVMVTIPVDVKSGQHLLIATQDQHDMNSGQPARSVFIVGAPPPPAGAPAAARPLALAVSPGRSGTTLVMIGLGVAVAGLLLARLWTMVGSRGNPRKGATVAESS